jgi:hypothetical protein
VHASGHVASPPPVNRTFVRILAVLCLVCGLGAAYNAFGASLILIFAFGERALLLPVAAALPFGILAFFLFRGHSWARRALAVLLALTLLPFASAVGGEVGLQSYKYSNRDISWTDTGPMFALLSAVLFLTVLPMTRRAFGRPPGWWWLEAALVALPMMVMFTIRMRESSGIRQELDSSYEQADKDGAELTRLLQAPESPETDARIDQLISAGASSYARGINETSPFVLASKNHPHAFKALLDYEPRRVEPVVWRYLAEGGHFELLPDLARRGIQPDPKLAEQFGVELIRMIREDRNDPRYREDVTGLIRGGVDLTVMDQGRTALDEAMRSGQTEIEDLLREQMKLPARSR